MNVKNAETEQSLLKILTERWSPYGFEDRPVSDNDLRSLFEAARWAASSYNEQPWNYLLATRENLHELQRPLSCLVEANQAWAKTATMSDTFRARDLTPRQRKPLNKFAFTGTWGKASTLTKTKNN